MRTVASKKISPEIPKGFVLVNLSAWQQKRLRDLAHECGMPLRDALRWSLARVESDLREIARVKRLTGLPLNAQRRFLFSSSGKN